MRASRYVSILALSYAADTAAQPGSAAAADCPRGRESAISEIACELVRGLGAAPDTIVVSAPLVSEIEGTDAARLSATLSRVVAGRIGSKTHSMDKPASLGRAQSLATGSKTLVYLMPRIAAGELRVSADLHAAQRSFWDRILYPKPAPRAHAFASRRLDPELKSFLPTVPLVARRIDKFLAPESQIVAIACGDVGADASLELVVVGRRSIHLGRIRQGKFVTHAQARWSELSPVSPSPLREPIAVASVFDDGSVSVSSTDRAHALRLDAQAKAVERSALRFFWPGGGCSAPDGLALGAALEPCAKTAGVRETRRLPGAIDAMAGALVFEPRGGTRVIRAGRLANQDSVVVLDDNQRSVRIEDAGAQLAVGDLDGDGQPEILASSSTRVPKEDRITVRTWRERGDLLDRFALPVAEGVRAIAACPWQGDGMATIAVATRGKLWLIR